MSDNIELNLGSGGDTLATDEYGGAHYQKNLIAYDAAGTPTVADQDGLPVAVQGTVPVSNDALTELAAAINSSILDVNVRTGGTIKHVAIDTAASGDTELVAAQSGKFYRVLGLVINGAGAVDVKFKNGTTDVTGAMDMAATTSIVVSPTMVGCFATSTNTALNINLSGAVQVSGFLTYLEIDG